MQRLFFLLPLILFFTIFINIVQADELDQITQQINDLQKKLEMSKGATAPHEAEVNRLEKEMNTLSAKIDQIAKDTVQKEKDIAITEKKLEGSQKIFEDKVRSVYKKSFDTNLEFLKLFLSPEINDGVRLAAYHQAVVNKEKRSLIAIALSLKDLEDQKKELEKTKIWLAAKGVDLEKTAKPIRELVAGAKKYQASLTTEIAGLTAKQQALLAEKTASFTTSVGDVPAADDPASRPDYNPGFSPAYAGFSFGAPHRKGMSQYGAYGRAKNGQSAEDILRAYYGGLELKKDYSTGINITVQGYGTVDIETYVKRIYEVPNQWGEEGGMEALKAQAVAARSYALAYTNNGSGSICATESCQVYKGSNKGGKWEEAVNATRGWVLVANGKPFSTW